MDPIPCLPALLKGEVMEIWSEEVILSLGKQMAGWQQGVSFLLFVSDYLNLTDNLLTIFN